MNIAVAATSTGEAQIERIVRMVLCVARMGEVDHCGWWGTHLYGAAGRVVLGQRLPRTWRMAAVELDLAAAAGRHNEILDRPNAVHLFSDNWPPRRWAGAWVAEQKTAAPPDEFFEWLEKVSSTGVMDNLRVRRSERKRVAVTEPKGRVLRVGFISRGDLESPEQLEPAVTQLATAYTDLGDFAVPYLEVEG